MYVLYFSNIDNKEEKERKPGGEGEKIKGAIFLI